MRAQRTKPLPAGMTDRGGGRILAQVYDKRTGKRRGKTFSKRELASFSLLVRGARRLSSVADQLGSAPARPSSEGNLQAGFPCSSVVSESGSAPSSSSEQDRASRNGCASKSTHFRERSNSVRQRSICALRSSWRSRASSSSSPAICLRSASRSACSISSATPEDVESRPGAADDAPQMHARCRSRPARAVSDGPRRYSRRVGRYADVPDRWGIAVFVGVRPAGIEPAACGLKDRCSLAPRREPLTTELRARAGNVSELEKL